MKSYSNMDLLVLIFWIFLIFLFLNELFKKDNDTFKNISIIKIYNFNTTWCGHSKAFQPVWDNFVSSLDVSDNIKAYDIKCDNDSNNKLIEKYRITGFPTVIIDNGNSFLNYEGARSVNALRSTLNLKLLNEDYNVDSGVQIKCGHKPTINNQPIENNKTKIYNFNTKWCGYSVRFQPIWDEFTNKVTDPNIEVHDIKCDQEHNNNLCKKFDIPGYPSIVKVDKLGSHIYEGPRTVEGLMNYL